VTWSKTLCRSNKLRYKYDLETLEAGCTQSKILFRFFGSKNNVSRTSTSLLLARSRWLLVPSRVKGLEFRVSGLGFRVWGLGFGV